MLKYWLRLINNNIKNKTASKIHYLVVVPSELTYTGRNGVDGGALVNAVGEVLTFVAFARTDENETKK